MTPSQLHNPTMKRFRSYSFFQPLPLTVSLLLLTVSLLPSALGQAPPTKHRSLNPAAPLLPPGVVVAMQQGKYADSILAIDQLIAKATDAETKTYLGFIRGTAERLDGKLDLARKTWTDALKATPKSVWASKIRFELAAVELASGKAAAAEQLAHIDAEALLNGDRKDRLAEVYYAFARKLLKPDDLITPADPNNAYALLKQGRDLAKGEKLQTTLRLEMAKAAQAANNFPQAISDYQAYLKEVKTGDKATAKFGVGECQFALNDRAAARITWTDLAAELGKIDNRTEAQDTLRAKAMYLIGNTHGLPAPPDDTQLNLGNASRQRYLAAYPSHVWSVRAAFELGSANQARGKSDAAIAAYNDFLKGTAFKAEAEEAKRDLASQSMTATYQIAFILQSQEKFDDAINAYAGYLAKFPNGPQSADAQRAILDTKLQIAADAARLEKYADARTAWATFAIQNPLDPRVPGILYQIGETFINEKKHDEAIRSWDALISKFPGSEPASHAQFVTASISENQKGDAALAIDQYRKVSAEPWASMARQRIAVMESKELSVITPRAFRSGETPHLKITSRNLESLTFTAYKLNPEAYFRKKQALGNVEALDISLVAADAEWTVPVPTYAKYKPVDLTYDLKVKAPGVWVVKVTDDKNLQATTLVLGSDLDVIVKTSREQLLIFAQDMKTGKGRPNARVLVSDLTGVILDKKTGPDGVLLTDWEKPRNGAPHLNYLVLDNGDVAGTGLGVPAQVAQGLSARAYIYTDRPAYRPGQKVSVRGVVREIAQSQYANPAGEVYKLEVFDSRGRVLVSKDVKLTAFGSFDESLSLDSSAPVGPYRVRLHRPGKSEFAGSFLVQSYHLEKIDLAFDLPKTVYFRGEKVSADVIAKYSYGAPVAGRAIAVSLPDGRTLTGLTDPKGKFHVEFTTEGFAEEQTLSLVAQLPQDNVATAAQVSLAIRAFSIGLTTNRDLYLDGETFALNVKTTDAQGKPIGEPLGIDLIKRFNQGGRLSERITASTKLTTDKETGAATTSLKVDDTEGGQYVVRVSGKDRFGNAIFTDRILSISGSKDQTRLRIIADRQNFKVGETAQVSLLSRSTAGPTLITWEGDRVIQYRIVDLKEGLNNLTWLIEGPQFPNFTLNASRMATTHFDNAKLDIAVSRELRVSLKPKKPAVKPGELIEVEISTLDQMNKPVAAELSVALVDRSLLRVFNDNMPTIGNYFYNQKRTGAFSTTASNTFAYHPASTKVSDALVEEAETLKALADNRASQGQVRMRASLAEMNGDMPKDAKEEARDKFAFGVTPAAPAMAAPAPFLAGSSGPPSNGPLGRADMSRADRNAGGMPGMMGGMGGGGFAASDPARRELAKSKKSAGLGLEIKRGFDEKQIAQRLYSREMAGRGNDALEGMDGQSTPRERFSETAYWNPSVTTDAAGKATLAFKAPMALSEYQFTARGVTGADTLVGQTNADLIVKKDFFVDLKTPDMLTQGDKPRFIAQIHHMGITGPVTVSLTAYAGERTNVYPKEITVKADGIDEVMFDPFEIPEGESVRLTLKAVAGEQSDELVAEIPIKPWGVQAFASASGTSSDNTTVFVGLPQGRAYENPEMLVTIAPTLKRLIIELALGDDAYPLPMNSLSRIAPSPSLPLTVADRASDLIAASSALNYLRWAKADQAPEAQRIVGRIQGLVAELITLQNDDGGWPWVAPVTQDRKHASDRMTSSLAAQAFAAAASQGLLIDPGASDRAANYLAQQQSQIEAGDLEMRTMVQHALATLNKGSFESANALNRVRASLPDASLAELAMTFASLDRVSLANEVLDILVTRARSEAAEPGKKPRRFWLGANQHWHNGVAETTALVALAYARIRPQSADLPQAIDWLMAHRSGNGWQPHKARWSAIAAMAKYYGQGQAADDRYRLVIMVNDTEIYRADINGSATGKAIAVPRKALKIGDRNRVRFDIEGRGTFGYSVNFTGFARDLAPEQKREGKPYTIDSRDYLAADPELDGKTLATGFSSTINPTPFVNKVTQVGLGGKSRVQVNTGWIWNANRPSWERDFLIVEEPLPAGTTLIDGSLQSTALSHTLADGVLTLYFAPGTQPGSYHYDVYGYLPGTYRTAPTKIRSAYDPAKQHLGPAGNLRVLSPGETGNDPYKATPDELLARGITLFDQGKLADAAVPLEELFAGYTLRDDILKDVARKLLTIHISNYQPRKIVQDFEVLKEKAPDVLIPFDEVAVVGRAYRDIGEHERAYLVWRAIVEASYLEDAQVGEVLRQKGKSLDAISYLIDLWREYPNTASIEADFFGLSQLVAVNASKAFTDPAIRTELATAGVTRSELILQAIRMVQVLLTQSPKTPLADEASLALVGSYLELEDFDSVVKLSDRFTQLYPKSNFLDSFQYSEALGQFNLGKYDRAIEVAEKISKATYKDGNGVDQPSPNKWQAIYILGQIYDARRQPAKAVTYYKDVADRFTDAAGAVKGMTRKDLKLPEVSFVRPGSTDPKSTDKPAVKLDYRNIAEADVKVYPVDLMRLYLTRRNLDAIAGIDLAGITPLYESTIKLGDGQDFDDKNRLIDLPLTKEGAYLVMVRGENLYTSGIVLVSPLELEILEEPESGRVRVTVRDAKTKAPVPKVNVKVIGTANPTFLSGQTDLRGVYVAENVNGQVTAVARKELSQYAFYRGKTTIGAPPQPAKPQAPGQPQSGQNNALFFDDQSDLGKNIRSLNTGNGLRQIERLENRYKDGRQGIKVQEAK